ncbi:MAG: diacylglycerol kinase family protein [Clostridia bacterium]|nr:diacylglycerol kinase family protein [Clostridia bacterium]
MENYVILYNPHSGGGKGLNIAKEIEPLMGEHNYVYQDMTAINDYDEFLNQLPIGTDIILTGGDGTLNSFINNTDCDNLKQKLYFYASGSGNDFARDIKYPKRTKPLCINDYIKNLPTANINGKVYKFINCVGSGMDGYCCAEVERLRALGKKRANYTFVAIKALLGAYKPCDATVTVDGVTKTYKYSWLTPTMNGRFFGGGFMAAPNQDRLNEDKKLTTVAMHSNNFFHIVVAFLRLMKGTHTKMKFMIDVNEGFEISVKLSKPAPLQLDGEVIGNVTEYTVHSAKLAILTK